MYYVYQYIDPRNGLPFYVGKGTGDRKFSHLNETLETTINKRKYYKIQSIIRDGVDPIIEEVCQFTSEEEAYNYETELIKKLGRKDYDKGGILMNITIDSNPPNKKGCKLSEEHKAKIRGRKLTEEQKQKLKGRTPWNKGLTGLPTWNKGLSGLKGTPCKEETKELLKNLYKNKPRSDEAKAAMSAGWIKKKEQGYIPHNKGKKGGTSATAIPCVLISPTGEELLYNSFRQGCLANNLPTNKISEVKNGHLLHYKGWTVKR